MKSIYHLVVTFVFASLIKATLQTNNEDLANHYLEIIKNSTTAALNYEFPTDARMYEPGDLNVEEFGEFDFIVVGAGATGCVIANRLSEVADWNILLLEAGTFPDEDLTGMPALWANDMLTKFNWGFETTPQKNACLGNTDRKCKIPKGKGVGGSTLINGILYTRGNHLDYQTWANLLNDSSWTYDNLLPYFKKSETFTHSNPYTPIDSDYHGTTGPLHMTHCEPPQKISDFILNATQELGYDVTDYNGKQQLGASIFQVFAKHGKRYDAGTAFVAPIRDRKNLVILERSYVTKVYISNDTNKAEGIIFTRDNKTYIARSRKEVILSAGVVSSPQILILSGIGPQEHLESLGIPVVQNLPVGENLRDHTFTFFIFSSNNSDDYRTLEESARDYVNGQGPLTRPFSYEVVGWLQTALREHENFPDIELLFYNISGVPLVKKLTGWNEDTFRALDPDVPNPFVMILAPCHAKSKGTIRLKSADAFEYPLIDLNLLAEEEDVEVLYEGVKLLSHLTETEAFRSIDVKLATREFPGCNHTELYSKEYWYCYLRKVTGVGHHQIGTCSTGTSPKTGVVDTNLKVFGVKRLRVADASVIPFTLSAHPNAVCNVIGEKVSDLIKKEYASYIPPPNFSTGQRTLL